MTETPWNADIRLGWLVSDDADEDGRFYAVRNDGKVLESCDRWKLVHRMASIDIAETLRKAFEDEP